MRDPLHKSSILFSLLVYVLCPHSVMCLNNHVVKLSRFSFSNRNEWVARITIIGWIDEGTDEMLLSLPGKGNKISERLTTPQTDTNEEAKSLSKGNEPCSLPLFPPSGDCILLPHHFKELADKTLAEKNVENGLTLRRYVPQLSSIVLTTNEFGDFSKSTVISELIDKDILHSIGEQARVLWLRFVHQPQTARCLVFFLLLGELCLQVAKQYKDAIEVISSILNLDVRNI
jgi:hypothetical protein